MHRNNGQKAYHRATKVDKGMSLNNGKFTCNGIFRHFRVLLQFVHCSDAFHYLGVRYPGISLAVFSFSNCSFLRVRPWLKLFSRICSEVSTTVEIDHSLMISFGNNSWHFLGTPKSQMKDVCLSFVVSEWSVSRGRALFHCINANLYMAALCVSHLGFEVED